uniref:MalY/PatB family protein n=1 Tax=Gordonia sp. B7-2 TaxID=3420932 RepID=UPI003D89E161
MSDSPVIPELDALRKRTSVKWTAYPDDVLPMFIAEMDFELAPVVADAIIAQVRASDLGYAGDSGSTGTTFAGFAERRWGWQVDPADVSLTTDVSVVLVEALRVAIDPGDGVIVMPPIYPPFFEVVPEAGGRVVEVPLSFDGARWAVDLPGIEAALYAGARAILLCHPHNPLGLVHSPATLYRIAEIAAKHDAVVISDEIHAPLVHPGIEFVPFLDVSDTARRVGIAAHSASKAFNIAGVKCAMSVVASDEMRALIARQPEEVRYRTSILGRAATDAAFSSGDRWLDDTITRIVDNVDLLEELLADQMPGVVLHRPSASYLAWLDFRATGLGDDPAEPILERGRVALHRGPAFGDAGKGFARLNIGCSPEMLRAAIARMASVL